MINEYYYAKQLKKWIITFANIFAGLQVKSGKDGCGDVSIIEVPITYASKDRVVAALGSGNTQNKLHTLPMMSCYLNTLELAPERRHGVNMIDRRSYMEQGGVFPDDLKAVRRIMAIPYNALFDLSIYSSNTDQMYQILEQIFIIFDPDVQVQKSDAPFDWLKITKVELTGISNEENVPTGTEKRVITWNLQFNMPIWLTPPMEIKNDIINRINIRMGDMNSFHLNELDEDGNLQPFSEEGLFDDMSIDGSSLSGNNGSNSNTQLIIDEPNPGRRPQQEEFKSKPRYHNPNKDNGAGGDKGKEHMIRTNEQEYLDLQERIKKGKSI